MADGKEFIPGYVVKQKVGIGGMATVFLATEVNSGRDVALKLLHPKLSQNNLSLTRFVREAKLLCAFRHRNIVRGIKSGTVKGLYYLIMEFVDGESIAEILDRIGPLPEDLAFEVIMQIADALDYMQKKGIVHRDIKPDNILLTPGGTVKLCDLGLAKAISARPENTDGSGTEVMTAGTVQYMSPEQAMGESDVDIRSDIYSLGVTLYQMVFGKLPFKGDSDMDVLAGHVREELEGAILKSGKISHFMHYFIEKMMAKDKEVRYQNPGEIVEDISARMEAIKQMQFDSEDYRRKLLDDLSRE